MQANVVITQKDNDNKTIKTTISYVNPQASNAKLLALAQAISALTVNTFVSASKETKGDVL